MPTPEEVDTYSCHYSRHYIIGPPCTPFLLFSYPLTLSEIIQGQNYPWSSEAKIANKKQTNLVSLSPEVSVKRFI